MIDVVLPHDPKWVCVECGEPTDGELAHKACAEYVRSRHWREGRMCACGDEFPCFDLRQLEG